VSFVNFGKLGSAGCGSMNFVDFRKVSRSSSDAKEQLMHDIPMLRHGFEISVIKTKRLGREFWINLDIGKMEHSTAKFIWEGLMEGIKISHKDYSFHINVRCNGKWMPPDEAFSYLPVTHGDMKIQGTIVSFVPEEQ